MGSLSCLTSLCKGPTEDLVQGNIFHRLVHKTGIKYSLSRRGAPDEAACPHGSMGMLSQVMQ